MRELFNTFLMSVFFAFGFIFPGFCGVGDVDNREYVTGDMWSKEPYKNFVHLQTSILNTMAVFSCTGQYIAPNLILSAAHCIKDNGIYSITTYNAEDGGTKFCTVDLLDDGHGYNGELGDWAIFLVKDTKCYNDSFFNVVEPTQTTEILNAGYGWVRKLEDWELGKIKDFVNGMENVSDENFYKVLDSKMSKAGMKPLKENPRKLKYSKCLVMFEDCNKDSKYADVCNSRNKLWKPDYYPQILATTCDAWTGNSGGAVVSYSNSKNLYGVISYGLSEGKYQFEDALNGVYIAQSKQFLQRVESLKRAYPASVSSNTQIVSVDNTNATFSTNLKTEPENIEKKINITALNAPLGRPNEQDYNNLIKNLPIRSNEDDDEVVETENNNMAENVDITALNAPLGRPNEQDYNNLIKNLPVAATNNRVSEKTLEQAKKDFDNARNALQNIRKNKVENNKDALRTVQVAVDYSVAKDNLDLLQKAYDEAKEKEQSFANRALTAASIATSGIGGMQLAQGLAEQKVDKEAMADMNAYISTMRCSYGDGKSVQAGTKEIELPGGNDETMTKLRNEYFTLAKDLKERKNELGLKPGIESEEILDKSQIGLYDDENVGIQGGNYTSIYRAEALGSETDKAKIEESQKTSKTRVIGGAAASGIGVAGGVVGDSLINGKLGEKIDMGTETKSLIKNVTSRLSETVKK